MGGSGSSTPTKPVPAPRRGSKPKEPSASDKLQIQNTVRQFYKWMDKLGKCVCCAYQKRRNVTKVGRPTEKRTSRCPRGRRIFLHKSLECEFTAHYACRNADESEIYNYTNGFNIQIIDSLINIMPCGPVKELL